MQYVAKVDPRDVLAPNKVEEYIRLHSRSLMRFKDKPFRMAFSCGMVDETGRYKSASRSVELPVGALMDASVPNAFAHRSLLDAFVDLWRRHVAQGAELFITLIPSWEEIDNHDVFKVEAL